MLFANTCGRFQLFLLFQHRNTQTLLFVLVLIAVVVIVIIIVTINAIRSDRIGDGSTSISNIIISNIIKLHTCLETTITYSSYYTQLIYTMHLFFLSIPSMW